MRKLLQIAVVATVAASGQAIEARAAEGGASAYLFGFRGSLAGIVPPPGKYLQADKLYYQGSAEADRSAGAGVGGELVNFQIAGVAVGSFDAELFLEVLTGTWITKQKVLGGQLGFGYTQGVGWVEVNAEVGVGAAGQLNVGGVQVGPTLSFARTASRTDDLVSYGDPYLSALLGWHAGNFHWNLFTGLIVPIGDWEQGRLSNTGLNRWTFDLGAAFTWLDPKTGLEFTAAPAVMFNVENPDTNYDTGTEFRVEFAAIKTLTQKVAIGVAGYHYQQLTGDSGSGARLGDFKGRVTALGPNLKLNFNVRGVPVSVNGRWLHEFNVKRRLEGDTGFLTVAIPLGVRKR